MSDGFEIDQVACSCIGWGCTVHIEPSSSRRLMSGLYPSRLSGCRAQGSVQCGLAADKNFTPTGCCMFIREASSH